MAENIIARNSISTRFHKLSGPNLLFTPTNSNLKWLRYDQIALLQLATAFLKDQLGKAKYLARLCQLRGPTLLFIPSKQDLKLLAKHIIASHGISGRLAGEYLLRLQEVSIPILLFRCVKYPPSLPPSLTPSLPHTQLSLSFLNTPSPVQRHIHPMFAACLPNV